MEENTTKVEIADRTGHQTLNLTKTETMSRVQKRRGKPGSSQEGRCFSHSSWQRQTGPLWGRSSWYPVWLVAESTKMPNGRRRYANPPGRKSGWSQTKLRGIGHDETTEGGESRTD